MITLLPPLLGLLLVLYGLACTIVWVYEDVTPLTVTLLLVALISTIMVLLVSYKTLHNILPLLLT